jgi:CheY-like chemotaxis protein
VKAQKFTLLVVEDDDDQRMFIQREFKALGAKYKIHALSSGNDAIAYLNGEGGFGDRSMFEFPSYIITDLGMSDGDGFAILHFLKSNPALSVIPVVMLSSSDDPDDVRHAYLLGVSSFFVKPSSLTALRKLLGKIHEYWTDCEVPEVDAEGYALETISKGKRGERFPKPTRPPKEK